MARNQGIYKDMRNHEPETVDNLCPTPQDGSSALNQQTRGRALPIWERPLAASGAAVTATPERALLPLANVNTPDEKARLPILFNTLLQSQLYTIEV